MRVYSSSFSLVQIRSLGSQNCFQCSMQFLSHWLFIFCPFAHDKFLFSCGKHGFFSQLNKVLGLFREVCFDFPYFLSCLSCCSGGFLYQIMMSAYAISLLTATVPRERHEARASDCCLGSVWCWWELIIFIDMWKWKFSRDSTACRSTFSNNNWK